MEDLRNKPSSNIQDNRSVDRPISPLEAELLKQWRETWLPPATHAQLLSPLSNAAGINDIMRNPWALQNEMMKSAEELQADRDAYELHLKSHPESVPK